MAYEYENEISSLIIDNPSEIDGYAYDEIKEVYNKSKAFDELKKHVDEEGDSYMDVYRQTKDPIFSLLNSNYDGLLGYIEELERADDER